MVGEICHRGVSHGRGMAIDPRNRPIVPHSGREICIRKTENAGAEKSQLGQSGF